MITFRNLGGAVAVGAALLAGTSGLALAQADKNTVVIAYPTDPASLDPIQVTQGPGMPMMRALFDQPLEQKDDLSIGPRIVKSYKWIELGKVLEVTLRDDVTFHNGDKLTTEDFKFTYLDRLKDNKLALSGAVGSKIADIEIKSPTVAVITMKSPFPTIFTWWSFLANFVVPKKYFESVGGQEGFIKKPVGSGPYKFVEYERGSRLVLERYDGYWGEKAKTQRVVVQMVKDASARVASIQSKQVDIAYDVPLKEAARLGQVAGLKAVIEPIANVMMLQIRNIGVMENQDVRLAMHYAVNKQAISRALFEGKAPAISFTGAPGMAGEPKGYTFPYDLNKAKEHLAKAGYSPTNPAKLTLLTFRGVFPNDWEIANILVQQWKAIGVDATIEQIEQPQYYDLNHNGKLKEATLFNWAGAGDPEMFTGYIMNPSLRFSAWKSDDMKAEFDKLFVEMDQDKRMAEYARVQKLVVEKGYTIPLLQSVGTMVTQANVSVPWATSGWINLAKIVKN